MSSLVSTDARLPVSLAAEAEQALRICNACRYCEGFCAVFPALERRRLFVEHDIVYLANLCHDCGECLYSCQYAPPHPFALHLPKTLAAVRRETYIAYAWPAWLAQRVASPRFGWAVPVLVLPLLALVLLVAMVAPRVLFGAHADADGAFYAVVPHDVMIATFAAAALLVATALAGGLIRYWRDTGGRIGSWRDVAALRQAAWDAMTLRYLDGGGEGCAYPDEVPATMRRWFHHATAYGFLLCFIATSIAAVYHNVLGWEAPYPFVSAPVLFGTVGGAGLLVGPAGLLWLKTRRDPRASDASQSRIDRAFLALLFLVSATGFVLLAVRETRAMGLALGVHLGLVFGLFVTMPYGKFVHAMYRTAALVQHALESRVREPEHDERF